MITAYTDKYENCFFNLFCIACATAATITLPLERYIEKHSVSISGQSFKIDFYDDRSGFPQGGIILTHEETSSQLITNLAHVLSLHGWSVSVANLDNQPSTPKRTLPLVQS
jgi:hypothetical protein